MKIIKKLVKALFLTVDKLLLVALVLFLIFIYKVRIPTPEVDSSITPASFKREEVGPNHYRVGNNWIKKNQYGIWEMYLEGDPYERGVIYGVLAKETVVSHEVSFVNQINELIPSKFFQRFLQFFIAWFNRDMDEHISEENLKEIYGISLSFADEYDFIGPKFYRILYYHGAHDIGHALTDLRIVGCTSFAVKDDYTEDGELLLGRNFDFYMGDEFAKDKLFLFLKPNKGYGFTTYSWAGFTGVVSGMNEKGLTVTINASKSDIPFEAKTPISLLAREILQYCKNIDEAVELAKSRETFVSESILIGSAEDHDAALIEKSPSRMGVYRSPQDWLVCANHYQSDEFLSDSVNIKNIQLSDSKFRFDKMKRSLENQKPLNYEKAGAILRDKTGLNGENIGYGNAKSLNQLIAHHAILFKPESHQVWISTPPYQLGAFLCYNVQQAFENPQQIKAEEKHTIPEDTFVHSEEYKGFEYYKETKKDIIRHVMMGAELNLSDADVEKFIASNPNSYEVYFNLGRYYEAEDKPCEATEMYKLSLTKVIASKAEEIQIVKTVSELQEACQ